MDVSGVGKWVEVGRGRGAGGTCFLFAISFVSVLLSRGLGRGGVCFFLACFHSAFVQ